MRFNSKRRCSRRTPVSLVWRGVTLVFVLVLLVIASDVYLHRLFESDTVGELANPSYFIKCEGLDFRNTETVIEIRLTDNKPFPQFASFREFLLSTDAPIFLEIPASFGKPAGKLRFLRFDGHLPDVLFNPKPDNQIHEAAFSVVLEPLGKFRNDALAVDTIALKFPGFAPFSVRRLYPVSQEANLITQTRNNLIEAVELRYVPCVLGVGVLGTAFVGLSLTPAWLPIVVRAKRSLESIKTRFRMKSKKLEQITPIGVVLPATWNEESISIDLGNFGHRPNVLKIYTENLLRRFVLGQDTRTATVRIHYLKTKLEELKAKKEIYAILDDFQFRKDEFEIRSMEKDLHKMDLRHRQETQGVLRDAEHKRDLLKIKAESAQFEKQVREARERPEKVSVATASPDEKIQELRGRIQRVKEQRAYARESIHDPDELKRKENQYDDKIADLEEEINKLL